MSKYIVEIKSEYEDSFKGLMILGAKDSNLFVDTLAVEELEELNSDYINEHYGDLQDVAYQKGLADAWKTARRISVLELSGGLTGNEMMKIYGTMDLHKIYDDNTASEAIEKLKAYEEKQKVDDKIEVGDEVVEIQSSARFCVTHFWVNNHGEKGVSGFNHECSAFQDTFDKVKKTGRHFDIEKILEEMRE